jgi:hypothetical protein
VKWLLVAILIGIVATRRWLVGDLVRALRDAPRHYREGKRRVDDPASAAKPIEPARERDDDDDNRADR